jgi:hypothetical protein
LYCHRGNELIKIPKNWLRDDMLYRAIWSRGGNYWALETMGSLSGGGGGGVTSHTALDDLDIANQHDINVLKNVGVTTSSSLFIHDSKVEGTNGKNLFMGIDVAKDIATQPHDIGATGSYNTALGYTSLTSITKGRQNTALGYSTLEDLTTGNDNTALGYMALSNVTRGKNNTALGSRAGRVSAEISGCVFLGFQAGENETDSSKLHIANNPVESLIEGNFSSRWVKVNGTLQFQLPNVETPASASLAGMMRYRETTTNSYIEVCMKTGATTYQWLALAPK